MSGRFEAAHRLLDQSTRRLLRIGDRVLLGFSLLGRAMTLLDEGRLDEASEIADKALREWERGGNRSGEAWTLTLRGEIDVERGLPHQAVETLEAGRRVWVSVGGLWGAACASAALARAYAALKRMPEARDALRSSLSARRRIGDERGLAECLEILAVFEADRRPEAAAELAAAAAALRARLQTPRPPRKLHHDVLETAPAAEAALEPAVSTALSLLG